MMEIMLYLVFTFMLTSLFFRFYVSMVKDYDEALDFYMVTDYAYQTFETLKVELFTHRETYLLEDNILYVKKSEYAQRALMEILQIDHRLVYRYDTRVVDLCHGLKDVNMRLQGEVFFLTLVFEQATYERGFYLGE